MSAHNNHTNASVKKTNNKKSHLCKEIGKLFKDCLRKTSVRGLPRIVSAQTTSSKIIWIVAVIALLACLAYNILILTLVYWRGDTIITWMPWTPAPDFPAITLCDMSTVPENAMDLIQMTPAEYASRIHSMAANTKPPVNRKIMEELLTPISYYDHVNESQVLAFAKTDSLIIPSSCLIYYVEGNGLMQIKKCEKVEKVKVPNYFSCTKVQVNSKLGKNPRVLRVVFHAILDSEAKSLRCKTCMFEDVQTLASGALLFLHYDNEYPIDIGKGLRIDAATQNIVYIKPKKEINLKKCQKETPKDITFAYGNKAHTSKYKRDLCLSLSRHTINEKMCDCSHTSLPRQLSHEGPDHMAPSCVKQNLSANSLNLDKLKCVMKLEHKLPTEKDETLFSSLKALIKYFSNKCPKLCEEVGFPVSVSSSKGINKGSVLDIYDTYMRNQSQFEHMKDRLNVYERALLVRDTDPVTATKLLYSTQYLEENFITLDIRYSPNKARVYSENYILSISAFISQIGGLLALFSGITLICIAEITELCYLIFDHIRIKYCVKPLPDEDDNCETLL